MKLLFYTNNIKWNKLDMYLNTNREKNVSYSVKVNLDA